MVAAIDLEELKKAADYRVFRFNSRVFAFLGLVMGALVVLIYVVYIGQLQEHPIGFIPVALGVLTVLGGILLLTRLPIGMIINGISLSLIGLWFLASLLVAFLFEGSGLYYDIRNVFKGGLNAEDIGTILAAVIFICLTIGCISAGIINFVMYKRFSAIPRRKPGEESVRQLNEIISRLAAENPGESRDIIEFKSRNYRIPWKGRLFGDIGVFGLINKIGGCTDVVCARRDEVQITNKAVKISGGKPKLLKASFRIGQRNFSGKISPEYLQRYEAWKSIS
jgi:hypothetical protein